MTNRMITTESTRGDGCPRVELSGGGDMPLTVTVTYHAETQSAGDSYVEISFLDVLEIRWIECDVLYEQYFQHQEDYEFGLIEILDSAYLETMNTRGGRRARADIGDCMSARHFRIAADDWGELNVISNGVNVRRTDRES